MTTNILKIIINLIRSKKEEPKIYNNALCEAFKNRLRQKCEDFRYLTDVRKTAEDMVKQYLLNPHMLIVKLPFRCLYMVYDEETAKYKNIDYNELINIEFKKLIEEYKAVNEPIQ